MHEHDHFARVCGWAGGIGNGTYSLIGFLMNGPLWQTLLSGFFALVLPALTPALTKWINDRSRVKALEKELADVVRQLNELKFKPPAGSSPV